MKPFSSLRSWLATAGASQTAVAVAGAALVLAAAVAMVVPARGGVPGALGAATGQGAAAAGPGGTAGSGSGAAASGPPTGAASALPAGGSSASSPGSGTAAGGGSGGSGTAGGAASPGSAPGGGGGGSGGSAGGEPGAGGGPPGTAAGGKRGCVTPPGSDQGVTATQIKIAAIVVNLVGPAANSTFGVASAAEQQEDFQQVIDSINAAGGVDCRDLVPAFYTVNPVDQSDQQAKCLAIQGAGVFAVMDYGAYVNAPGLAYNCFPGAHLPFFIDTSTFANEQRKYYPYLLSQASTADLLYHNTIRAFSQRGTFSAASGFKKLGYIYADCEPGLTSEVDAELRAVGLSPSQLVSYDFGCSASPEPSPADVEQAVLKFEQAGVTDVMEFQAYTIFGSFTTVAEQQGFHPRYDLPDDGIIGISYGPEHPDYQNVANAVAIESARFGEGHTPGFTPSAGTARCNAVYAASGRPPVYRQPAGAGGTICDYLWLLTAALQHAPRLQRSDLAAGLQAAGSVQMSYPYGPNDFTKPGTTTGGEFWRVDQFHSSCNCWQIIDRTFHPSFP